VAKIEKRHFRKGTFFMHSIALSKFLYKRNYTASTRRLLDLLLTKIEFNNRITVFTQAELAEELEITQSQVSRNLKSLEDDKIIKKDGHYYYFTDNFIKFAGDN
jgi:DNA-binding MarR family transcriptional regulator